MSRFFRTDSSSDSDSEPEDRVKQPRLTPQAVRNRNSSRAVVKAFTLVDIVPIIDIILGFSGLLFRSTTAELVLNDGALERFTTIPLRTNRRRPTWPRCCSWSRYDDLDDWMNPDLDPDFDREGRVTRRLTYITKTKQTQKRLKKRKRRNYRKPTKWLQYIER